MSNKLTKNQLALLAEILTQHCEDCDTSGTTAHLVDKIWRKIAAAHGLIDNIEDTK
jgi:site-specific recombinase